MTRARVAQCGTQSGYRRHLRRRELPCEPCLEVVRRASEARRRAKGAAPRGPLKPCGTWGAYIRHLRRREVPCEDCREAAAANSRAQYAAQRARRSTSTR